LDEKSNLISSVNPKKRQSFIRRLSKKPEKEKETQVSSMISGSRKAEKPAMFHAAEVLIERDGPHCIL